MKNVRFLGPYIRHSVTQFWISRMVLACILRNKDMLAIFNSRLNSTYPDSPWQTQRLISKEVITSQGRARDYCCGYSKTFPFSQTSSCFTDHESTIKGRGGGGS